MTIFPRLVAVMLAVAVVSVFGWSQHHTDAVDRFSPAVIWVATVLFFGLLSLVVGVVYWLFKLDFARGVIELLPVLLAVWIIKSLLL